MLVSKFKLIKIYEKILNDGIIIIPKNFNRTYQFCNSFYAFHLKKVLISLHSRKFMNEILLGSNYYWTLTKKGERFLRNYFNLII
ncbi:ribosomal protein S10 (nucleomorph) [Bigelowiella natans]|uniref:Ribosomal protein S10 n=1 Tax=Bigelowiella natans TaxID=227086 RepID=Q3LVY9_BIGNA|nr:ribosomal protein S10 [Bigelowiella natans]ABA27377.1 ribosomal protein S10 [Bigelowiella natans]